MQRLTVLAFLLVLGFSFLFSLNVHAETTALLQAKLDLLKKQLLELQNGAQTAFPRDLYLGISGEDVRRLQQVLNLDERTQVAEDGSPGSPGFETAYFGPQTERKVRIFQTIYKNEVLSPANLSTPTGYVGPLSRAKLNLIALGQKLTLSAEAKPVLPVEAASISLLPPELPVVPPLSSTPVPPADPVQVIATVSSPAPSGYFTFPGEGMTEEIFSAVLSSWTGEGQVLAAATSANKPFGGKILDVVTCANGLWIQVGPPRPGTFMFIPGASTLYQFRSLTPGAWVLGQSDGVPTSCVIEGPNIPAQATILIVGTSR